MIKYAETRDYSELMKLQNFGWTLSQLSYLGGCCAEGQLMNDHMFEMQIYSKYKKRNSEN